jgi:hypothetical protein
MLLRHLRTVTVFESVYCGNTHAFKCISTLIQKISRGRKFFLWLLLVVREAGTDVNEKHVPTYFIWLQLYVMWHLFSDIPNKIHINFTHYVIKRVKSLLSVQPVYQCLLLLAYSNFNVGFKPGSGHVGFCDG